VEVEKSRNCWIGGMHWGENIHFNGDRQTEEGLDPSGGKKTGEEDREWPCGTTFTGKTDLTEGPTQKRSPGKNERPPGGGQGESRFTRQWEGEKGGKVVIYSRKKSNEREGGEVIRGPMMN